MTHGEATLSYVVYDPAVAQAEQISDTALGVGLNMMREICGPGWAPSAVDLAHRAPSSARARVQSVARASLHFDCPTAAIRFNAEWLQAPNAARPAAIPAAAGMEQPDFTSRVIEIIARRIVFGEDASATAVARELGASRRTLNRRLDRDGMSFIKLGQSVRFSAASRLLRDTDLPITQIGLATGYSELSAFSRAYRAWAGQTPSEVRRERNTSRCAAVMAQTGKS